MTLYTGNHYTLEWYLPLAWYCTLCTLEWYLTLAWYCTLKHWCGTVPVTLQSTHDLSPHNFDNSSCLHKPSLFHLYGDEGDSNMEDDDDTGDRGGTRKMLHTGMVCTLAWYCTLESHYALEWYCTLVWYCTLKHCWGTVYWNGTVHWHGMVLYTETLVRYCMLKSNYTGMVLYIGMVLYTKTLVRHCILKHWWGTVYWSGTVHCHGTVHRNTAVAL